MPPTWFFILIAFCGGWAANTAMRIFMGHEIYLGGQKARAPVVAGALTIILVAFGIMAAISLGFIRDQPP